MKYSLCPEISFGMKYARKQVCESVRMEVWESARMQVWKSASMQVCESQKDFIWAMCTILLGIRQPKIKSLNYASLLKIGFNLYIVIRVLRFSQMIWNLVSYIYVFCKRCSKIKLSNLCVCLISRCAGCREESTSQLNPCGTQRASWRTSSRAPSRPTTTTPSWCPTATTVCT